jgi:arylsulfatase A-like enzyme
MSPFEPSALRARRRLGRIYTFTQDYTPEEWRRYRYDYYRLVEKVDREVGAILDALRETGLEGNTLVLFSSDHGDMCGAHQMIQKSVLYDESARVPFIVRPPGGHASCPGAGRVDGAHLVSNGLDLVPTLCDYAGLDAPEVLAGRSLRALIEGRDVPGWRDHLVLESRLDGIQCDGRMVRTERYKYVIYEWGRYREQLFDLQADPGEVVNLAVESRFGDVLEEHRRLLWSWCERTGDRFGHHYAHPEAPFILPS